MIKAIIFDLDDTLYDCSGQLVKKARERAAKKMVELSLFDNEKEAYEKQKELNKKFPRGNIFDKICGELNLEKNKKEEYVEKILEVYNSNEVGEIKPFPNVFKTLEKLKQKDIKLFLITSGLTSRQQKKIEKLNLSNYFDEIFFSDIELGPSKEELFQKIKENNDFEPGEILVIGDRIQSEIKLGNRMDMNTVRIKKGRFKNLNPKNDLEEPDFTINEIGELPKAINNLKNKKPKVAAIGGGTGQYTLLRGLKKYNIDLTAIVSTMDNGGSSGRLRTEFGILPPGDLRNCLLALADEKELKDLMKLFDYRFPDKGKENGLSNHSMGNLILTALTNLKGDIGEAVKKCSELLDIKSNVYPVSIDNAHVYAKTENGEVLAGQVNVSYPEEKEKIEKLWLKPNAKIYKDSSKAIKEADLMVICPGDLYGSILPNFLTEGMKKALKKSNAEIIYVCNLVTKQGTYGFKASDFIKEVNRYTGKEVDYIIVNTKKPSQKVVDKYKEEQSFFVEPDLEGEHVIKEDLLKEHKSNGKIIARHDSERIAEIIMDII